LALPGAIAFEIGLPHRFLAADALRTGWPGPLTGPRLYRAELCTADNGPVVTSAGYAVLPTVDNGAIATADTIVIPGCTTPLLSRSGDLPTDLAELLATARPDVRWVSICTGAFVLAALGLLDGQRATTHWAHADRFTRLFPRVDLDPNVLFVDNGNVLTSAGNAAGIDLLLHVVRRDHGSVLANRVARSAVVAPWRDGGQAQFIDRPLPAPAGTNTAGRSGTAATREWALRELTADLDLAAMAAHAGMSVRTFTRRFREETGETAGTWLARARVDRARDLLETTDLPIDRVAARAGFGTTASFRQHLAAAVGLSPMSYRRRFRADAG
jgi:transcriptional regulator GlxA family with amidase domain